MYSRDEKYPSELHESREGAYRVIITISRSNIFHFHICSCWLRNDMFIHLSLLGISSLLCICVTLPPLYNYMDSIVRFSKRDFDYCEVNSFPLSQIFDTHLLENNAGRGKEYRWANGQQKPKRCVQLLQSNNASTECPVFPRMSRYITPFEAFVYELQPIGYKTL